MTTALIRSAFESVLATWAAAQSPEIPVAWQNVHFTPPAGRFIESFILPADTESRDLAGQHREYRGIFQVSVNMPAGSGAGAGEAIADSLAALYPTNAPLVVGSLRVFLLTPMSPAPPIVTDDRYVIPVSCSYRADTI